MFNFNNTPKDNITKEFIYSKVSQEEIWYYYVPDFGLNKRLKSPLRAEKNPSFTFKRVSTGDIIFTDWGLGITGDIFTYFKHKYNLNYLEALRVLYNDLVLNKPIIKKPIIYNHDNTPEIDKEKVIIPVTKPMGSELLFWRKYNIDVSTLVKYRVMSCEKVMVWSRTKNKYFVIKANQFFPIFSYMFKENGKKYYKIYRPNNKEYKWLFNGTKDCIEGYDQLPWLGELLIISKALKDVMVLDTLGFNAISLQSETNSLEQELINKLTKRFKKIVCFYDNDEAGMNAMNKIKEQYNIPFIYIDKEYGVKDIADFIKVYGVKKTKNFLYEKTKKCRREQEST